MKKKDYDHFVGGPYKHQTGGWENIYFKDGKRHSEYRKDKREAEMRAEYWKKTLAPGRPAEEEDQEHPVHFWNRTLREAAWHLKVNQDREAASVARALASLAAEGLKAAKFLPPPEQKHTGDDVNLGDADLDKLTSEELAELLGNK